MKANKIIVICPFSRPEFANNVIKNFTRQNYINKELIIIENGSGLGTFVKVDFKPTVILNSDTSAAHAKNKALEYIRDKYPDSLWTTFDDDDYYYDNYLSELAENSDKAEVVGKLSAFVHTSEGKLRILDYNKEHQYVKNIWGNSISSYIKNVEFPLQKVGEDNHWLDIMKYNGAKVYATSRYHSCINRFHKNNTWATSDLEMVRQCTGFTYEFDSFDESIITGNDNVQKKYIDKAFALKTIDDFSKHKDESAFLNFMDEVLKNGIV